MKKLLFLVSFSILLQSCFSYKSIDYNNIEIEKKQKFKVLNIYKTNIKGRLVSENENTIVLENKGGLQTIPKGEIYDVKVRKFSFLKTTGLVIVSPYILGLLFIIIDGI